jgi:dimethylhistidine N-methyltransferase
MAVSSTDCYEMQNGASDFRAELIAGLSAESKWLPTAHLFSPAGSKLFDLVRRQPEYYLVEVEDEIYGYFAAEIADSLGHEALLVDLGRGGDKAGKKVCSLLDSIERPAGYVAVDASPEVLQVAIDETAERYPGLPTACVSAEPFELRDLPDPVKRLAENRVLFCPGGMIGDLDHLEARALLASFQAVTGADGKILMGVDLRKPADIITKAYRDKAQITDRFHLNLLRHANRELGTDFDLMKFRFDAIYDEEKGRMELYVVSMASQEVSIDGQRFAIRNNERIRTQFSYKYTTDQLQTLVQEAGWRAVQLWMDSRRYFAAYLLEQ